MYVSHENYYIHRLQTSDFGLQISDIRLPVRSEHCWPIAYVFKLLKPQIKTLHFRDSL